MNSKNFSGVTREEEVEYIWMCIKESVKIIKINLKNFLR